MEFGQPQLRIREPLLAPVGASSRVRAALERRLVVVGGEWHLWFYRCEWSVRKGDVVVGDSTSRPRIDRAARFLDGQKLVEVVLGPRGARTRLVFDLGAELDTRPVDRTGEQWLLYEPSGHVLTLRADRKVSYGPGNLQPEVTT